MNRRRIALRSFRDLCAFVGLIVLVSYFYNWTVDIRHWYVTLASAFVCLVLWLGFYVLEAHGDAVRCSSVPVKKSFPGAESKWQVSQGGGEEPRWRSDDKELFYLSSPRKLTAVEVNLGSTLEKRDPVELFQTRSRQRTSSQDVFTYSVGGRGQRFLVNTIVDEPNAMPLSITLNWTEKLKKK